MPVWLLGPMPNRRVILQTRQRKGRTRMGGFSIDMSYLRKQVADWEVPRDPLEDPTGIAVEFGKKLQELTQAEHLSKLNLLVRSAIPWIHLKNLHDSSAVIGDTPL